MDKNKQQLEKQKEALEILLDTNATDLSTYSSDLEAVKKQLKEINKPEITTYQMDEITETIEMAVDQFDFTDIDNWDLEYEIDYDGRVSVSNMEFNTITNLQEEISERVLELFKESELDLNGDSNA
tara:strand:- start:693 stop:1070 length:378 start_codon:yes stop_codon:yes gene_type:complete